MTTKELEHAIYFHLAKMGTYLCFEVMMPFEFMPGQKGWNNERVDLLTFDTVGKWRFYELKVSVSDFRSKAKHTFYGNLNYYVMPKSVYEKVASEIPDGIGCYVVSDEFKSCCYSVKKAEYRDMKGNEKALKHAFMQALSRQHHKLMLMKRNELRKENAL